METQLAVVVCPPEVRTVADCLLVAGMVRTDGVCPQLRAREAGFKVAGRPDERRLAC